MTRRTRTRKPPAPLPTSGKKSAPIMVICDSPTEVAYLKNKPISKRGLDVFATAAKKSGFSKDDFYFVAPCKPMSKSVKSSAAKVTKHIAKDAILFSQAIRGADPKCVVLMGNHAIKAYLKTARKISSLRGIVTEMELKTGLDTPPVFGMLSPSYCLRQPQHIQTFEADFMNLKKFREDDWEVEEPTEMSYTWETDLDAVIAREGCGDFVGVDVETLGVNPKDPSFRILTVQISPRPGRTWVLPVDPIYKDNPGISLKQIEVLKGQIKTFMENEAISKTGHNFKFDYRALLESWDVKVEGWTDDTILMFFAVDDNALTKNLDDAVKRYVPEMSGYNDWFHYDKSRMDLVPPEDMLKYAGGDPDASLRLYDALADHLYRDERQANCYEQVMMPVQRAFADCIEHHGNLIDSTKMAEFEIELRTHQNSEFDRLVSMIPSSVLRRHVDKGIRFSRGDFIGDALFSDDGFGLVPTVFTKGSRDEQDHSKRIPSVSIKDHLPYHAGHDFVDGYINWKKNDTLQTRYVKGFMDKYATNSRIYPSYSLFKTVTGRSASDNPNGQNFPKRGPLAKTYNKVFVAPEGWDLFSIDLSQAELRLVAWMANDQEMLEIYANGGDIHTATAMEVNGLSQAQWDAIPADERGLMRFKAKAVNFGFIYGMGWRNFIVYAKTDYGIDFTEAEAQHIRSSFFRKYSALPDWHTEMKTFARRNGYVRSIHGALRRLPAINSIDDGVAAMAERQAINSPIQRFASDLGLMAMAKVAEKAPRDRIRLNGFVHDAVTGEVRSDSHDYLKAIKWQMENLDLQGMFGVTPPIPICADVELGPNKGQMEELSSMQSEYQSWLG